MTRFCFILFLVLNALFACQPADKKNTVLTDPKCLPGQSQCVINTPQGEFTVLFNVERVLTETPFEITVLYLGNQVDEKQVNSNANSKADNKGVEKISGYLEGKDMFMGKIPLFLTENKLNEFNSQVMLGSCSRPDMVWRLWLTAQFSSVNASDGLNESEQVLTQQQFFIDFPSSVY